MSIDAFQDKIDLRARKKSLDAIRKSFKKIIQQIEKGVEPKLVIRKRTLANTVYDPERKLLLLGKNKLIRRFLDEGEARRFMQTVLMASIIYEALANNEYPTIRDLYYRGKHTLPLTSHRDKHKNTWEEQKESDAVLRDVEVLTRKLREEMLILSKEKGKVVGNMKIRSGGDLIDLSRMGHGAYAIESTPDLIDFRDVDAEYVLIVEKDAVFQQLHRIGYWRKTKSILITSAGQPDRATRRFVRRLNEELKLPVYILADSIVADEVVPIQLPNGKIVIGPIEELVGGFFDENMVMERIFLPLRVPAWNRLTGDIEWRKIGYVYRHFIDNDILSLNTGGRGVINVTKAHSLFVYRDGEFMVIPARDIKVGDHIVAASSIQNPFTGEEHIVPETSSLGRMSVLKYALEQSVLKHKQPGVHELDEPVISSIIKIESSRQSLNFIESIIHHALIEDYSSILNVNEYLLKALSLTLLINGYQPKITVDKGKTKIKITRSKKSVSLIPVLEIKKTRYRGFVYDFMVPNNHSFIGGNGIVYHNSDPYGFYIYSVFKIGSITLSYESERLATPSARFMGVMMSDVFGDDVPLKEIYVSPNELKKGVNPEKLREERKQRYIKVLKKAGYKEKLGKKPFLSESERKNYIIKAKPQDLARAVELVGDRVYRDIIGGTLKVTKGSRSSVKRSPGYPWFKEPKWIKELGIFFLTRSKLEIEAVASKGLKFLAFEYLPAKIETNDWLD